MTTRASGPGNGAAHIAALRAKQLQATGMGAVGQQNLAVAQELKFVCLQRDAEQRLIPQLSGAIEQAQAAGANQALAARGAAEVFQTSTKAMVAAQAYFVEADSFGGRPKPAQARVVEQITGRVNQLSAAVVGFQESPGFSAALERANDTQVGGIEASMNRFEGQARQALGVANLPQVEAAYAELEGLVARSATQEGVSPDEIAAVFARATQAATIIGGAIEATSSVIDDSKQGGSAKDRLRARAQQARQRLMDATLKVEQDDGKLRAVFETSGAARAAKTALAIRQQEVQAAAAAKLALQQKLIDSPEKKAFVQAAQTAYDHASLAPELRRLIPTMVTRALKLFVPKGTEVKVSQEVAARVGMIATSAFDVLACYMYVTDVYVAAFQASNQAFKAAGADRAQQLKALQMTEHLFQTPHAETRTLYQLLLEHFWSPYLNVSGEILGLQGGEEVRAQFYQEYDAAIARDTRLQALIGQRAVNAAAYDQATPAVK